MGVCTAGKLLDYDIKTTFYCGCLTKYHSDRINEITGHKKSESREDPLSSVLL